MFDDNFLDALNLDDTNSGPFDLDMFTIGNDLIPNTLDPLPTLPAAFRYGPTPIVPPPAQSIPPVVVPSRQRRQGQVQVQCQYCLKSFSREPDRRRHVKSVHDKINDHLCRFPGCNKSFPRKDKLTAHQKSRSHYTL
ncbi:hypothetical protein B0J11DRAFT_525687 [Dendryphion nanum]|uniref:C2H2-type domain-containing protein n=1 Tax=Dendryphion nanum TaxID=256645 RepID=A0A9P9DZS6_9PLEO|nr:hypothetical protein B0J11DRAFT_525687 [Dendryphion nanum]